MLHRLSRPLLALMVPALALGACSGPDASRTGQATPEPASPPVTPGGSALPAPSPARTSTPQPPQPRFVADIRPVSAGELGPSWRQGCPVGPDQLRQVRLSHWGFDGQPHTGTLVVHRAVAADVATVFRTLYERRFPIRKMVPVAAYGGSDDASMADANTSGFNCRNAVDNGPARWSAHAYGRAVDVNPVENPYLLDGAVLPPAGRAYTDRTRRRPGMAVPGGVLVKAFTAAGWAWGGTWSDPDYQHFSVAGG
jgi:D-alanyl-D-alanine carboxypeptidase